MALNEDHTVYLTYCTDINDVIICVADESKLSIAGYYLLHNGKAQKAIYVHNIVENSIPIEEIINKFEERYQGYIDKKQYSIRNGDRGEYSTKEIERIKNCYSVFF